MVLARLNLPGLQVKEETLELQIDRMLIGPRSRMVISVLFGALFASRFGWVIISERKAASVSGLLGSLQWNRKEAGGK